MIAKAPKGKGTQADIEAMKADVAGVEAGLADFEAAFSAGRYKEALAKAEAANQTLERIKADIQAAIDAKAAARGSSIPAMHPGCGGSPGPPRPLSLTRRISDRGPA